MADFITITIPGYGDVDFPASMTKEQVNQAAQKLYLKHGMGAVENQKLQNPGQKQVPVPRPLQAKPQPTKMEKFLVNAIDKSKPILPPGMLPGQLQGAAKGAVNTLYDIGDMATLFLDPTHYTGASIPESLKPHGAMENIGYYGEQLGEFMVPDTYVTKGATLAGKAPKFAKAAKLATRMVGSGLESGALELLHNPDVASQQKAAAIGTVMPAVGDGVMWAGRKFAAPFANKMAGWMWNRKLGVDDPWNNPIGQTLVRENPWSWTLKNLGSKVENLRDSVGGKIDSRVQSAFTEAPGNLVYLGDTIQPIDQAMASGQYSIEQIRQLQKLRNEITSVPYLDNKGRWLLRPRADVMADVGRGAQAARWGRSSTPFEVPDDFAFGNPATQRYSLVEDGLERKANENYPDPEEALDTFTDWFNDYRDGHAVDVIEGTHLKRKLGNLTKFNDAYIDAPVNAVKKQSYGNLTQELNRNVPGLENLNTRYSNLTEAGQAIQHRIDHPESIISADFWKKQLIPVLAGAGAYGKGGVIPAMAVGLGTELAQNSVPFLNTMSAGANGMNALLRNPFVQQRVPQQLTNFYLVQNRQK